MLSIWNKKYLFWILCYHIEIMVKIFLRKKDNKFDLISISRFQWPWLRSVEANQKDLKIFEDRSYSVVKKDIFATDSWGDKNKEKKWPARRSVKLSKTTSLDFEGRTELRHRLAANLRNSNKFSNFDGLFHEKF